MSTIHNERDKALQAIDPRLLVISNTTTRPYIISAWIPRTIPDTPDAIIFQHSPPVDTAFPINMEGSIFITNNRPSRDTEFTFGKVAYSGSAYYGKVVFYSGSNYTYLGSAGRGYIGSNEAHFKDFTAVTRIYANDVLGVFPAYVGSSDIGDLTLILKGGR